MEWRNKGNGGPVEWRVIEATFNNQVEARKTKLQLKNHYNMCKDKWKAFDEMRNMTGIELDARGLPSIEEQQSERMKTFLKTHGTAGNHVVKNELVDIELWHAEFVGRSATGKASHTAAMVSARRASDKQKEQVGDDESGDSDEISPIRRMARLVAGDEWSKSPPRSVSKTASTTTSKKRKERHEEDEDLGEAIQMLKLTAPRLTIARRLYQTVDAIEYVKERGLRYKQTVLKYLKDNGYEELFLELPNDEERVTWIDHLPF